MLDFDLKSIDWKKTEGEADALIRRLFPICRSITGEGVRETLRILQETADFKVQSVPSGTACYDWTVPDEWNVNDAYVADAAGRRVIDFKRSNLHLVSYSIPIDQEMGFEELDKHLHTMPELPGAIPYRTSYYQRDWGFCLSYEQYKTLDRKARYRVKVDTRLTPGVLNYGERLIQGEEPTEILISTYCCHPSLGNDNLSGIVLWALLLRQLAAKKPRYTYRFAILPETIGAITYLHQNEAAMKKVRCALVLTTVAGPGPIGFKESYQSTHEIDRIIARTLADEGLQGPRHPFDAGGSDERQYSSPFFRIPTATICKDKYYEYNYYHTSLDNLDFISAAQMMQTYRVYLQTIQNLEANRIYRSLNPKGEPMLSRRGLYPGLGGWMQQRMEKKSDPKDLDAIMWLMFHGDGKTSLLDIAEKTRLPLRQLHEIAELLKTHGLLEAVAA